MFQLNNMNNRPRYSNLPSDPTNYYSIDTTDDTAATTIKEEYSHYDHLPDTSVADTIFTITQIKNEPVDTNEPCSFEQTEYVELAGIQVKQEPGSGDYGDDICDPMEDGDTNEYENQFIANTIIKEEIMIECEPDMEVLQVTKSNSTNIQQFSKRRKKIGRNWQKDTVFALESDALDVVKNEKIWTKYTTNKTDKGRKVIYRCRNVKCRGPQCEAGIYLFYAHVDQTVTLFRSVNRHTCNSIDSKRKPYLRETKRQIKTECETKLVSTSDSGQTDNTQNTPKRRKKIVKNWQPEKIYEAETEALAAVKSEQTWAKYTTNKTDKGNKVIYRCRNVKSRGQQCEAGVYLLHAHADPTVTLFRSVNRHTCDSIEYKRKPYVRSKIKIKLKTESEQQSAEGDENQKKLRRRKKVVKNWQREKSFELEADALEAVRREHKWTKYTTNKTDKGNKVIYRCRNVKSKGQQCDAGLYILYSNADATITIYRSANKHTCDIIESKSKSSLSDDAKSIIRTEYEKGQKPKHILGVLIANGFTSTKQIQINNFLAQLRRELWHQPAELTDHKTLWAECNEDHSTIMTSQLLPNMFSL